jgi:succinate dehydrogenase / fumarate reductase, cytochrome b subunit
MQPVNRPLSPHLQIYRLPMLALISITHRITGVALCAGTVILVYWLVALAAGPEAYASAHTVLTSTLGQIILFGFSWALYFHLCNGVRHLVWDVGMGLDVEAADASGRMVIIVSALLTIFTWIFTYALSGGAA